MGLRRGNLEHYMSWADLGLLPKTGGRILDIGAQQINAASEPQIVDQYIEYFGGTPLSSEERAALVNDGFVGTLHRKAGFEYASVDVASAPDAINIDLNFGSLPAPHVNRYHLVTNHGTSEHIVNQLNVFKVIHDATIEGGIMHHLVPANGAWSHGIFNYNPKFFWALKEANNYKTHHFRLWVDPVSKSMRELFPNGDIVFEGDAAANEAWLNIVLQKTSAEPFKCFNDPAFAY